MNTAQSGVKEQGRIVKFCLLSSGMFFVGLTFATLVFYTAMFSAMLPNSRSEKEILVPEKPITKVNVNSTELEPDLPIPSSENIACRIPRLDPHDSTIKHLIWPPANEDCTREYPYIFNSTTDFQLVPQDAYRENKTLKIVSCCYQRIERSSEDKNKPDDTYKFVGECKNLSLENTTQLDMKKDEFVAIFCDQKNMNETKKVEKKGIERLIMDTHAFVPLKPQVEKRIEKYYSQTNGKESYLKEEEKLNVVILGIDGTSHMSFLRTMPNSYDFLMKNLSAVEFHAVNKVGDGSYPNLAAMLTYQNASEMSNLCEKDRAFDECPFIWKSYAAQGYRTSYGEDSPWMGTFNYVKKGFFRPPTDYYLRPFAFATEELIGTHKQTNAKICYGPRLSFQVLLDYMQKFAYTMGNDKRYFQFIWATSLTHDALMGGSLGDSHLLSTLQFFQEGGYLNNTVFILTSDYGFRWGKIQTYLQGHLEQRLPFLYFIFPKWFKDKYKRAYHNLKHNQDILTTPFDFHQTLEDLLKLERLQDEKLQKRENILKIAQSDNLSEISRGISQFLPLPRERTCQMAGIPEEQCTCHTLSNIKTDTPVIQQAANFLVYNINQKISEYSQCAYLILKKILSAETMMSNEKDKKGFDAYQISIMTSPGYAVFEATVIRNSKGDWRVSGSIQRIDQEGDQSNCINRKDVKSYCYCVNYLKL